MRKAKPVVDKNSAEDPTKAGRLKQIRMVASLINRQNPKAMPIVFGSAAGIIVVFVLVGLLTNLAGFLIPLGVLLGLLTGMILFCSLLTGIWPSSLPTWNSKIGTSCATRAVFFFSAASRPASREGAPSPTRMTPGRPTVRCTTSMFLLAVTAGVTVQLPRMDCSTAAAAPGCPSIAEYWAPCANRPNRNMPIPSPSSRPSGIRKPARWVSSPISTNTTMIPAALPKTIGSALGFCLLTRLATIRICFSRPTFAGSSALFLSTTGSAFSRHACHHPEGYGFSDRWQ